MAEESPAQHVARIMKEAARKKSSQSLMTHTPDGGSLIYIGADEDDVTAVLLSSALQIEQRRRK